MKRATLLKRQLTSVGVSALLSCATLSAAEMSTTPLPPLSKGGKFAAQDGKGLYKSICQGCHMSEGQGANGAGMYPALANNTKVASAPFVINNVLNGRNGMPGLGIFLSDVQVAALVTYVRTNMGNNYPDTVDEKEVAAIRKPAKGIFDE